MAGELTVVRIGDNSIAESISLPRRIRLLEFQPGQFLKLFRDSHGMLAGPQGDPLDDSRQFGTNRFSIEALILDADLSEEEGAALETLAAPYRVFFTNYEIRQNPETMDFLKRKAALYIPPDQVQNFLYSVPGCYWKGQYGSRLATSQIEISRSFAGTVTYHGHSHVELSGDFGSQVQPVACWKKSMSMNYPDKSIDFWPEIHTTEGVSAKFRIIGFGEEEGDVPVRFWEFDSGIRKPFHFDKREDLHLSVELLAGGKGTIRIGPLHYRDSRNGAGYLLPGGERYCDPNGEELFAYYEPGDGKGPLNVFFCEGNGQERFLGLKLMRTLEAPVLMLLDTRLSNGKYYIGTSAYETMVAAVIRDRMEKLGFGSENLILSGMSSGAYGALYYGCEFHPRAVVLGKPLLNPGSIAVGERLRHPGVDSASLDVLMDLTGEVSASCAEELDRKLWERFDDAEWEKTKFAVIYMKDDDLDPDAYDKLLSHMERKKALLFGKGIGGRHGDSGEQFRQWFYLMYRRILIEEFGRSPEMAL